jgi:2-dehydropantoate 2-reductase
VASATAANRSSMLRDLETGRRTEVAAIHAAVVAAGEAAGVETPANRVIAALVRARERAVGVT